MLFSFSPFEGTRPERIDRVRDLVFRVLIFRDLILVVSTRTKSLLKKSDQRKAFRNGRMGLPGRCQGASGGD